ncbi:unnamed protein product, partial [Prorocentrum cordatum]
MDGTAQRDWEFLLDADQNTKETYPTFEQGSLAASNAPTAAEARHFHEPTEPSDRKTDIKINIATFNAQTGQGPKEGAQRRKEKTNMLKTTSASLFDEDLHVIGIQKTRAPRGMRDSEKEGDASCANANSNRAISNGHQGCNYGCALHVLLSKPHGKCGKKELFFEPGEFTTIEKAEKTSCWKKLTAATEKYQTRIILIDANARTGDITSAAIGDQGTQQEEDPNGRRLHELLLSNYLVGADAFVSHGPERCAWHSGTSPRRIDYVIVPRGYLDSIEACSVPHGIDDGCDPDTNHDRYPVGLELAYEIASS